MDCITIVSKNYLSFAHALSKSYTNNNPNSVFYTLIIDGNEEDRLSLPNNINLIPNDLEIDPVDFARMAFYYDVTELATSLKPWALQYVIDQGAEVAMYLDPDIQVFDSLQMIEKVCPPGGIVLTPHTISPLPRDDLYPSEEQIMGSGIYNLGFIAVSKTAKLFLNWWKTRLFTDSISEPSKMLFTDQRWVDWAPSHWPVHILRDPGCNVAYWNLDHRELSKKDNKYYVNESTLKFFHFSGYNPSTPWILSKHTGQKPRVLISENPLLGEITEGYANLTREHGVATGNLSLYGFNTLSDGTKITPLMRRFYREEFLKDLFNGTSSLPVPFSGNDMAVLHWFNEPVSKYSSLTRFTKRIWDARPDLQSIFPHPNSSHSELFRKWAQQSGVIEGLIPQSLVPHKPQNIKNSSGNEEFGINLSGYFSAELGMGVLGRLITQAVQTTSIPYKTITNGKTLSRKSAKFIPQESHKAFSINVAAVNADQFPSWANEIDDANFLSRKTVGVWAWEVEEFPDALSNAFQYVDEIWAISEFTANAIKSKTSKPVFVLPLPILANKQRKEPWNQGFIHLGIPSKPYFYFAFDYLSIFERKNPLALIEAFKTAFDENQGPILVIKSINGDKSLNDREKLRYVASKRKDIYLIEDYLDADDLKALMSGALAYVSLHRSEGYGLTCAEAMSHGVPVIATSYSGNLDFMNSDCASLIPYTLVKIPNNVPPYPPSSVWAEPDIIAAARAMRVHAEDHSFNKQLGQKGRDFVRKNFTLENTGYFIEDRVMHLHKAKNKSRKFRKSRVKFILSKVYWKFVH